MRLRATITEGDSETTVLVPLGTVLEFTGVHGGRKLNEAIDDDDFVDWEPWVGWNAAKRRLGETREFEAWCDDVDWVQISNDRAAADPSGGEPTTPTPSPSPESQSGQGARGQSS